MRLPFRLPAWSRAQRLAVVLLLGLALALWLRPPSPSPSPPLPATVTLAAAKELPDLAFTDRDGAPMTLAAFHGKLVVLDMWATWCGPCREEFPRLDRLQERLGDQGVMVVALSMDRGGRAAVDKFTAEVKVPHLAVYLDPSGASATALGLRGLPTTLVIDRQGRERARLEGVADWDGPEMVAQLQELLAEP